MCVHSTALIVKTSKTCIVTKKQMKLQINVVGKKSLYS